MTSIGLATAWTQLVASQTALDHLECVRWSIFPLNQDKRLLLKEKSTSFEICFGLELKKRVNECFGDDNLLLEQKRQTYTKIALWRVTAGNSRNSRNSRNSSVSSHRKKQIQEIINNIYREGWKSSASSPRSPQVAGQKGAQTSLGSGSMPIDEARGDADELPASPQSAVPLSLSNVRRMNEQLLLLFKI